MPCRYPEDRLISGIKARFNPPPHRSHGYRADTINMLGDETNNLETNRNPERIANERPTRFLAEGHSIARFARKQLEDLFDWARANDVTIYASYPGTIDFPEYGGPEAQASLSEIEAFYQGNGIPLIGTPEAFMYHASLFYDTRYHLTDRGMTLNTDRVMTLLDPYMHHLATHTSCCRELERVHD